MDTNGIIRQKNKVYLSLEDILDINAFDNRALLFGDDKNMDIINLIKQNRIDNDNV